MNISRRIRTRWHEIFHRKEIDAKLLEMNYKDGRVDALMEFPGVAVFAGEIAGYFDKVGAPNWVELTLMDRASMRMFVLTIQRKGGETPAGKIKRLEDELAELREVSE